MAPLRQLGIIQGALLWPHDTASLSPTPRTSVDNCEQVGQNAVLSLRIIHMTAPLPTTRSTADFREMSRVLRLLFQLINRSDVLIHKHPHLVPSYPQHCAPMAGEKPFAAYTDWIPPPRKARRKCVRRAIEAVPSSPTPSPDGGMRCGADGHNRQRQWQRQRTAPGRRRRRVTLPPSCTSGTSGRRALGQQPCTAGGTTTPGQTDTSAPSERPRSMRRPGPVRQHQHQRQTAHAI
jgi:hypothetical protein